MVNAAAARRCAEGSAANVHGSGMCVRRSTTAEEGGAAQRPRGQDKRASREEAGLETHSGSRAPTTLPPGTRPEVSALSYLLSRNLEEKRMKEEEEKRKEEEDQQRRSGGGGRGGRHWNRSSCRSWTSLPRAARSSRLPGSVRLLSWKRLRSLLSCSS